MHRPKIQPDDKVTVRMTASDRELLIEYTLGDPEYAERLRVQLPLARNLWVTILSTTWKTFSATSRRRRTIRKTKTYVGSLMRYISGCFGRNAPLTTETGTTAQSNKAMQTASRLAAAADHHNNVGQL